MDATCGRCGAALPPDSARCAACGKTQLARARELGALGRVEAEKRRRATVALRIALYGSLAAVSVAILLQKYVPHFYVRALVDRAAFLLVGLASTWWLSRPLESPLRAGELADRVRPPGAFRDAIRNALGRRPRWRDAPVVLLAAAVAGAAWWVETLVLLRTAGSLANGPETPLDLPYFVVAVLLPPFDQEWLCRGATWEASRRVHPPRTTWLLTSAQFALIFAVAYRPFNLVSRFGWGLLFGWVRRRTDSVGSCVLAHVLAKCVVNVVPLP